MLKFLATTENTRKSNQKIRVVITGKLLKNTSKIAIRIFTRTTRREQSSLVADRKSRVQAGRKRERERERERERRTIDYTRVTLEWKGGQLKLPSGPDRKTYS